MRIGILGTGLIGTSIGLGLTAAGWDVAGWDPDPGTLERSGGRGALVAAPGRHELLSTHPDVVVLAGPPASVVDAVAELDDLPSLVMDVTGVKLPVVAASRAKRFVGTHPMAGREVTGPEAASGDLFRGAAWVVVTDGASDDDLTIVDHVVVTLGARSVRMSAADHDVAVAVVSHLPQLLASTLMNEAADRTDALELVAGSFRDLTRVAASDPAGWVDLLDANRGPLLEVLEDFLSRLGVIADRIGAGDRAAVGTDLERARDQRRRLAAPTAGIRVALADRPGELVRVGHAFENSGVDVRDLQLRHSPHGGGGVLTISVRPGDERSLRRALEGEGLLVVD